MVIKTIILYYINENFDHPTFRNESIVFLIDDTLIEAYTISAGYCSVMDAVGSSPGIKNRKYSVQKPIEEAQKNVALNRPVTAISWYPGLSNQ